MKKKVTIVYYTISALLIFYIMVSALGSYNVEFRTWNTSGELETVTYQTREQISEDTSRFSIPYSNTGSTGNCLLFYTCHQFIKVYADESLIYAVEPQSSRLGRTSGTRWNFVSIPFGTQTVCVELTAAYESARAAEPGFYLGNGADMYRYLLKKSMASLIITVLTAAIGIALILFWLIIRRKFQLDNAALYFGTFSLIMGIWSMGETNAFVLTSSNPVLGSFSAFVLLMMMTVPFVLFIREIMRLKDQYIWKLICLYSFLESLVCLFLLAAGVRDLKETAFLTHISMGLAVCYMVYGWVHRIYYREKTNKPWLDILGVVVIVVSVCVDLCTYYSGSIYVDAIGRFGFLAYIAIFAFDVVSDSIKKVEDGKKAVYYKELASIDRLTGLYNRNAFIEDTGNLVNNEDMLVVTFDLNDLKQTNDALGHTVGDKYIVDASSIIRKVFSPYGKCYRIGGDEFCTIIMKSRNCKILRLVEKLKQCEQEYNRNASPIIMNIACGYACYDPLSDASLEDTRTRADERMYEDKAKLKNSQNSQEQS